MSNQNIQLPIKVFNTQKTDYTKPEIIFGQEPGLFDTINKHYPELWKLYKGLKELDWDENEFDYSTCNVQFKTCDKHTYDMMIKTLAWQWEADSVANRSITTILGPVCTSTEAWAGWSRISENECYIDGTEALTPTGWKDLKDITLNDLVAQYSPEDRSITFVNPTDKIEKEYEGSLFSFKSHQGHFHQVVTPNHRMLVRKRFDNSYTVKLAHETDYQLGSAKDLISADSSGYLSGIDNRLTTLERFFIAVQADGFVSDRYDGSKVGTIPVWFSFSKQRKIDRLINIVTQLGFTWTELTPKPSQGNTKERRNFKVNVPLEYSSYIKNFSYFSLAEKDLSWCRDFLNEIIHWDGHYTKNTGILNTTNEEVALFVQAVASVAGMKTHLRRIPDNRKETFNDIFRVTWKDQPFTSGQTIVKEEIPYKGTVRCLTVPSGFFVVRYKNAVSIGGNCLHAATYSEIVRNSFDDPSDILDEILSVQESIARLQTVSSIFDKAHTTSHRYALGLIPKEEMQDAYNDIFMFIVALLCLERIQFMASFAVTFAICDGTGLFQPIGKAVQKIAQDEFEIHVQFGMEVLKNLLTTERGQIAYQQCKPEIIKLINEVVKSEDEWINYAFSEGRELTGVTKEMMLDWNHFSGTVIAKFMGVQDEVSFPLVENNPLKYMELWVDISKTQTSPQEQDNNQYKVGVMKRDDEGEVFDIEF